MATMAVSAMGGEASLEVKSPVAFDPADEPKSYSLGSLVFKGPWGYDRAENATRSYPLLVSGFWNEGQEHYAAVAQKHPAFVLSYQKDAEADGRFLGHWITNAIAAGYRIDLDRVYLTGFSRGGSGSFPLARGMHEAGRHFAAIIRGAGQSQPDLGNAIAEKTAVWYHIGLLDGPARIQVAREALAFNRGYACNREAVESQASDTLTGHTRNTVTLTRAGRHMFRYSEYVGMGHTATPCYTDPALFAWLFNCKSGARPWIFRAEIDRLRPVVEGGGYVPGCDHGVPPDVSWPNYVETVRLLAQACGWLD